MTKAALENMVTFLAHELRDVKIRVTGIAPGLIRTDFAQPLHTNPDVDKASVGEAHQIGSVVACICSEDGSFMNGETYPVHGGFPKL
jgi:NAD(P)-dependent dehydrogenase (short-subunit alcohol dehydrogenase family)